MGPWVHWSPSSLAGEVDFGFAASDGALLLDLQQLDWFDALLKGVDNGALDGPALRLFVMGANVWRDEEAWPLARAKITPWYLHSGGAANTLHGDGALSPAAPGDEAVDTFVYDPRNPVPTRGGGLCCSATGLPAGAFDQRPIEARPDVLVYTTAPLEADLEVTGPIEVRLWAATSARDTDFTAKLVDVDPCGYARNLCDGVIRARHRRTTHAVERVEPGVAYERHRSWPHQQRLQGRAPDQG